jgi:hypothetical protein
MDLSEIAAKFLMSEQPGPVRTPAPGCFTLTLCIKSGLLLLFYVLSESLALRKIFLASYRAVSVPHQWHRELPIY